MKSKIITIALIILLIIVGIKIIDNQNTINKMDQDMLNAINDMRIEIEEIKLLQIESELSWFDKEIEADYFDDVIKKPPDTIECL